MLSERELSAAVGSTAYDGSGDKIGTVEHFFVDDRTGAPTWVAVTTGLFGTRTSFVPLRGASSRGEEIVVPYDKSTVKDAPNVEPDGALSQEEEAALYRHYGLEYSHAPSDTGLPGGEGGGGTDDAMTVSEEELRVGKTTREAGRARLRKWVETEHVSQSVPVAHEEVRIEREPITEGNVDQAMSGPEITESVHEVPLMEEEAVAAKATVPKERVRLEKDTVTEEAEVGADLRKERVEAEVEPPSRS